ncbi:four and a half LIM domains protein 2 isoform X4 [Apis mellifera carnica]|nr:four and a half LIM domains protein 2 isoform X4 [Apis mellifera carnica]
MADVDSVVYTTTERKVRKVKKTTKRRESHDQNAEVTITEVDSTQNNHHAIEEYVLAADLTRIGPITFSRDTPLLLLLLLLRLIHDRDSRRGEALVVSPLAVDIS